MAGCPRNRIGKGSRWGLAQPRMRTRGCQKARRLLECRIAVGNAVVKGILLSLRMSKLKSWLSSSR